MKDRFRVRAWNEIGKYYLYDVQNSIYMHDGQSVTFINAVDKGLLKNWRLEQCTGLKDKNGNLIYEGDILYDTYISYGDDDPYAGSVIYKKGALQFLTGNIEISFDDCSVMSIVGNIHKNPELLEAD